MIFLVLFATPLVSFKKFRCINYISFYATFFLLFFTNTIYVIQKTEKQKNWPYGWIELLYISLYMSMIAC